MKTMKELFLQFAKKKGVTTKDVNNVVQVTAAGNNGTWISQFHTIDSENLMILISSLGLHVPEEKREKVALMLTKMNFGIKVGAFQLNQDTGEITFRTSHYMPEISESTAEELIEKLTFMNFSVVDSYYRELEAAVQA